MREIDQCTYETEKGFRISTSNGIHWNAYDPAGEYLDTISGGLDEAMIYISTAEDYDD